MGPSKSAFAAKLSAMKADKHVGAGNAVNLIEGDLRRANLPPLQELGEKKPHEISSVLAATYLFRWDPLDGTHNEKGDPLNYGVPSIKECQTWTVRRHHPRQCRIRIAERHVLGATRRRKFRATLRMRSGASSLLTTKS
jgi:hypothetical protein